GCPTSAIRDSLSVFDSARKRWPARGPGLIRQWRARSCQADPFPRPRQPSTRWLCPKASQVFYVSNFYRRPECNNDPRQAIQLLPVVSPEIVRERALAYHMPAEKLEVVGLRVADRYCSPAGDKNLIRKKLGWPLDKPIVLMVGGGE